MKSEIFKLLNKIVDFLTRRKWLYKIVGIASVTFLFTEVGSFALPEELTPDYIQFELKYGYPAALLLALLIGNYASGYEPID